MKKILFMTIFMVTGFGIMSACCQGIPTYPIPSYNIIVQGYAAFLQDYKNQSFMQPFEKWQVNVEIKTVTDDSLCQATVWVYLQDHSIILGPYTAYCDEILTVGIDSGEWAVLLESEGEVSTSVWMDSDGPPSFHR